MLLKVIISGAIPLLLALGAATGADIYVPDDFSTIQGAINAAADGDRIIVRSGIYVENINFLGKSITVTSESGPENTVIDGNRAGIVVTFLSGEGEDSVLEGFTVKNGDGSATHSNGGGIMCRYESSPTIMSNIITGNRYNNIGGAGIYCSDSCPIITGNIINGNLGAISGTGGISCSGSCPANPTIISNNIIYGNTGSNTGAGGIYCHGSDPIITNNTIESNTGGVGGGIQFSQTSLSSQPIATNNVIKNNMSHSGGGIFINESYPTIEHNIIEGNSVTSDRWHNGGGGIYCSSYDDQPWTISENVIRGNSVHGDYAHGGGILCYGGNVTIARNIIAANTADESGGGLYCDDSDATVSSNVFASNSAANLGGGIHCSQDVRITNNTVHGNIAGIKGGGLYCYACSPTVVNTIFWDNSAPAGNEIEADLGDPSVTFCDVKGGWTGTGNIDADPLFVDVLTSDFHLTWDSPCRNAGDGSAVTETEDFEGDPRIHDGTVDMGGDEYHLHLYAEGDVIPGGAIKMKVVGTPGTTPVTLALGSGIQDPAQSTIYGFLHLAPPFIRFPLGTIPSNGVLVASSSVPGSWQAGEEYPFQALAGPPGNPSSELTNLTVLTVE